MNHGIFGAAARLLRPVNGDPIIGRLEVWHFIPGVIAHHPCNGDMNVKQVVAVIKPFLAEKVLESLRRAPLEACSIREVKGYGRQKSYLDQYGDSEYSLAFLPKVEITLWVEDSRVDEIVRKIVSVARTGRMGDGKIMVLDADQYESVP